MNDIEAQTLEESEPYLNQTQAQYVLIILYNVVIILAAYLLTKNYNMRFGPLKNDQYQIIDELLLVYSIKVVEE